MCMVAFFLFKQDGIDNWFIRLGRTRVDVFMHLLNLLQNQIFLFYHFLENIHVILYTTVYMKLRTAS